jgi:hypothetical protein
MDTNTSTNNSKRWFVVIQRNGRASPSLWFDYLAPWVTGKNAKDYGIEHVELLGPARRDLPLEALWEDYRRSKIAREWDNKTIGLPARH